MSDPNRTDTRDGGFSLVETMISTLLVGLIVAVLSTALVVTIRQQENTTGRLNVASGEQNLGIWLPSDLASGEDVSTNPADSPCGSQCPAGTTIRGSNALMLTWTSLGSGATASVVVVTKVSYRYVQGDDGGYFLERVQCITYDGGPPTCTQNEVASNMDAPPNGTTFVAGVTAPTWALEVTAPLDPADIGDGSFVPTETTPTKGAQRVTVTVNGGGQAYGAGGGRNQIVLSSGGTQRLEIDGDSVLGTPSFTQARSRCGGNIVIVVDESGSIGSSIDDVRDAVGSFVDTFAGTPVKLKVVRFSTASSVLGTTGWSRWFNMLNDSDVSTLSTAVDGLVSNGATNWEDALQRTFYNSDGTVQTVIPDLVVFFTDGVPTYSRRNSTSATASLTPPAYLSGYPYANGSSYNQEAWYRANYIAQTFRGSVRFIGVGVGAGITGSSTWLEGSPTTYLYERNENVVWERNNNFVWEKGNTFQWQRGNNMVYERGFRYVNGVKSYTSPYSNWESTSSSTYNSNNTVAGESDGWRTRLTAASTTWTNVTEATYFKSNTTTTATDGWRTTLTATPTSWAASTQALYQSYNSTSDSSDGWRTRLPSLSTSWTVSDQASYEYFNTTSDSTDGWRTRVTSLGSNWNEVTEADYTTYNSTTDSTDGWRVTAQSYLISSSVSNSTILRRLIAGNDNGVAAILQNGVYTNADQADNYILPSWSQLDDALRAVALAECGGTLTLQTKVGTSAAGDPFTYQNTLTLDGTTPVDTGLKVVTTTSTYPSGTFDFSIPSGGYVTVEVQPTNTSSLLSYEPGTWACKAGGVAKTVTDVDVAGSSWKGFRVTVAANEAVSCVQTVTRVP